MGPTALFSLASLVRVQCKLSTAMLMSGVLEAALSWQCVDRRIFQPTAADPKAQTEQQTNSNSFTPFSHSTAWHLSV
jgi:hypothetical protein